MKSCLKHFGGLFCSDSRTKLTPERFHASSQFSFLISGFQMSKVFTIQGSKLCGRKGVWQRTRPHCVTQATYATTRRHKLSQVAAKLGSRAANAAEKSASGAG